MDVHSLSHRKHMKIWCPHILQTFIMISSMGWRQGFCHQLLWFPCRFYLHQILRFLAEEAARVSYRGRKVWCGKVTGSRGCPNYTNCTSRFRCQPWATNPKPHGSVSVIVSCHGDSFCLGVISRKGVNLKFSNRIGKMMPKPIEFFEGPTIFMRILQPQTEFKSRNHLLNIVFFSFSSSFFPFFCLVLVFFRFQKLFWIFPLILVTIF